VASTRPTIEASDRGEVAFELARALRRLGSITEAREAAVRAEQAYVEAQATQELEELRTWLRGLR
jgi:hypothetical protein